MKWAKLRSLLLLGVTVMIALPVVTYAFFVPNETNIVYADNDTLMEDDDGGKCGQGVSLGWLICPLASWTGTLVDSLINDFILPMLQWRLIV